MAETTIRKAAGEHEGDGQDGAGQHGARDVLVRVESLRGGDRPPHQEEERKHGGAEALATGDDARRPRVVDVNGSIWRKMCIHLWHVLGQTPLRQKKQIRFRDHVGAGPNLAGGALPATRTVRTVLSIPGYQYPGYCSSTRSYELVVA